MNMWEDEIPICPDCGVELVADFGVFPPSYDEEIYYFCPECDEENQ